MENMKSDYEQKLQDLRAELQVKSRSSQRATGIIFLRSLFSGTYFNNGFLTVQALEDQLQKEKENAKFLKEKLFLLEQKQQVSPSKRTPSKLYGETNASRARSTFALMITLQCVDIRLRSRNRTIHSK